MRIVIPTIGSRGDVQPYVALGKGLRAAGHQVRLASHADFAKLVRGQGLDFFTIESSARALHESEIGRRMTCAGVNPFIFLRQFARLRAPLMHGLFAGCYQACQDADLIVITTPAVTLAHSVAEKLGLPVLAAHYLPMTPTRAYPSCVFPAAPAGLPGRGLYHLLTHPVAAEYLWQILRPVINDARRDVLGLPPLPFLGPPPRLFRDMPTLYGFSPAVVPPAPDWGDNCHVTGYWFLDEARNWRPPADLVDFLESGSPPVCIGFGSMQGRDREALTALVIEALERTRQRGILLSGWGGLGHVRRSDRIFAAESVPHDWLFPRTAAVIHHGGAGTTAAVLRAGVPGLVVPFMADQPFWGWRTAALGVGPRPIPCGRLSAHRLASAIRVLVGDEEMRRRAAALGERVRAEDGVGRAVDVFRRTVPPARATFAVPA